ncbi:MAG: right-handed parallel beta-helix repeat-containing protein, partial [Pseudomonadales bacterium]|nr:right-handed parallel beta-helix repeat-containing protein [Pseudomonadales bacterium]
MTVIGHTDDDISVAVENMTITNGANDSGGGIYVEETGSEVELNLDQLIITGNAATTSGGGVFLTGDVGGALSNLLVVDNSALNGAGIATIGVSYSVWNCTITGNTASGTAGGIYGAEESEIEIFNCILSANGEVEIALDEISFAEVDYSNISGGLANIVAVAEYLTWGSHNLDDAQNLFISRGTSEYSLNDFSPFIGQGSDDLEFTRDLYGLDRDSLPGPPDLGAIENLLASRRPESRAIYDGGPADADWFSDSAITTHWQSFIDDGSVNYEIAVGTQADTLDNIYSWTAAGNDTFYTAQLIGVNSGTEYFVSVRGQDTDLQMSDTTSSDGFRFDFIPPTVDNITEIQAGADRDYLSDSTNLTFTWSGSDEASGLQYYEYALDLDGSNILDWTYAGLDTAVVIASFPFVEGNTYRILVRAIDVAGNLSAAFPGDGFLIDYTVPETGMVFDGLSGDPVYTGSDTTIDAHWSGFADDVSGIAYYEAALGSTPQGTDILDWTSTLADTFVNMSDLTLISGQTYYVSVRVIDVAGNTSAAVSSSGITVDTAPPAQGLVFDGTTVDLDWSNQDSSLAAFWTTFTDLLSGTKGYSVSIGTAAGLEDVYTWKDIGDDTTVSVDSLVLDEAVTYFFNVIATDSVGNTSAAVSSNGITVDLTTPATVMDLDYYYYGPDRWDDTPDPLSGGASDELSGVQSVKIMINRTADNYFFSGGGWTADSIWVPAGGDTSWSFNNRMVELDNGELYLVYARAMDHAGNEDPVPAMDSLVYDSSPPQSVVEIDLEFYNHWNEDST